jgi:GGDEF domain-containing protein
MHYHILLLALALTTLLALVALPLLAVLLRELRSLLIDPSYGCLTRPGIERRYTGRGVVFVFDLDDMHDLNDRYGYSAMDARIAGALREACREGEVIIGRWKSGDELAGLAEGLDLATVEANVLPRLAEALARRDITAKYEAVEAGPNLAETVERAFEQVLAQKRERDRARRKAWAMRPRGRHTRRVRAVGC